MTWAPSETQKTFYQVLTGDATLQTLIGGTIGNPKVFDFVPDNENFPFITMQIKPWTDRGNHTTEGLSAELTIHVWYRAPGRGDKDVQAIQKRIDELIHSVDVCVDGWNIILLRRTFVDILVEPDNVTLHGVQKFNLLLGES